MFGRIFGLDSHGSYRELRRLEPSRPSLSEHRNCT
jgi:hypothetical protein